MNFRRIFEERNYDIRGHVLPLADTRLCRDMPYGFSVYEGNRDAMIRRAEGLLGKAIPSLCATDFMLYCRTGNRTVFENSSFRRRRDILTLAFAEHTQRRGRFTDAVVDLFWAMLEETSWVLPAHHNPPVPLPDDFKERVDYLELHAASTAADLATVYFLIGDALDEVTPLLYERLRYELRRRILTPFLDEDILRTRLWWSGVDGNRVNNWNPWIIANILTVCAITEDAMSVREAVVAQALRLLDNFTAAYHDDGGCDEGPEYWGLSCASLYDCCCLLYDMTGGYVDMFDDPLLRRMGEYKPAAYISGDRFLNFADATPKVDPTAACILDWGHRVGSEVMCSFGRHMLRGEAPCTEQVLFRSPYRSLRMSSLRPEPACPFAAPAAVWLDGLQIAVSREREEGEDGLYLAFKGGHNGESHNHCDVGTVTVCRADTPLFVDAGVGDYTYRTFGPDRYAIWSMRSDYHNTVSVNNCVQLVGGSACAKTVSYDTATGKLTLDLTKVYPKEARLSSYVRSAVLEEGVITLTDTIAFDGEGVADFHFLVTEAPTEMQEGRFRLHGCTVCFDRSLTAEVELCDLTLPETASLAAAWDAAALFRITLHAAPFTCRTFTLTVRK